MRSSSFKHDLLIMRHGETLWNRIGRMHGALDSPLTDLGKSQAAQMGRLLAQLADDCPPTWRCSPQGRARATAEIIAEYLPFQPEITFDRRLAEIGLGHWTGARKDEIAAAAPHLNPFKDPMSIYECAPGGEGIGHLADRCAGFLRDLGGPAVVITHGITSRVLRCLALGRDPARFADLECAQGVIFRISGGKQEKLVLQDGPELR